MLRPASRLLLGPSSTPLFASTASRIASRAAPSRRFLSTAPPSQQSRSWKNYGVRLALAGGVVYYYNTTDLFAEEPAFAHRSADYESEPENLPTIDALAEQRKQQRALAAQSNAPGNAQVVAEDAEDTKPGSVEELEQEAGQEGAFNPETGEINWDCPCLGGMAHGPCGEEFKAAFSCFVFSEEEPKGVDCIDKFQGMQTCFRQHPEIYGAELDEDDEYEASKEAGEESPDVTETVPDTQTPSSVDDPTIKTTATRPKYTEGDKVAARQTSYPSSEDSDVQEKRERAKKVAKEVKEAQEEPESPVVVPKADHESS